MQTQPIKRTLPISLTVRLLQKADLPEAKRIFHLAFGTFVGMPDPMQFAADRDYLRGRYYTRPEAAWVAEGGGQLAGSNFVANWGSVGVIGPLTIHPDFWDGGAASRLLEPAIELFNKWHTRHAGLFTFPGSTKHLHLYQKFGFWPRFLTAILSKPVQPRAESPTAHRYSELNPNRQSEILSASRELTDALYEGLDLQDEIRAVQDLKLGDTIFLWDNSRLASFAICHCGPGTEAGDGSCYIKFGAARSAEAFERLLDACEAFALLRSLSRVDAGVNTARHDAYGRMLARGFRTSIQGVTMHRPNEPGYNRPDVYILDDWR